MGTRSGRHSAPLLSPRGARCRPLWRSRPPPSGSAAGARAGRTRSRCVARSRAPWTARCRASARRPSSPGSGRPTRADDPRDSSPSWRGGAAWGARCHGTSSASRFRPRSLRARSGRAPRRPWGAPLSGSPGARRAGARRRPSARARRGPRPARPGGGASLGLAGGAARGDEPPAFVECAAGSALDEGGALRRLACALGDDPRAGVLRALAEGSRPVRPAEGLPLALVAISLERWDGRSRRAFEKDLFGFGFRLFATRAARPKPWEDAPLLSFRLRPGDAASLLWLPFVSVHDAVAAWREAEETAGEAAGTTDAGSVLEVARDLSARFDPKEGRLH